MRLDIDQIQPPYPVVTKEERKREIFRFHLDLEEEVFGKRSLRRSFWKKKFLGKEV